MQVNERISTGTLGNRQLWAVVMLLGAGCCCGCGSASSSTQPLFSQQTGIEVGGKLEIPAGAEFNELRDAFSAGDQAIVICFLSTECDATSKVSGRIKSLQSKSNTARFLGYVTSEEENFSRFLNVHKFAFEIVGDFDHAVAQLVGANRTPAFFVFDSQQMLVYRGPLDDSTLVAKSVRQDFLAVAISAASKGKAAPESRPFVGRPILGEH